MCDYEDDSWKTPGWTVGLHTMVMVYVDDPTKKFRIGCRPALSDEEWEAADPAGKRELLKSMYDESRNTVLRQWDSRMEVLNDAT